MHYKIYIYNKLFYKIIYIYNIDFTIILYLLIIIIKLYVIMDHKLAKVY